MASMSKVGLLACSAAFSALGVAGVAHGQIVVYVDKSNPTPGDGTSWNHAFTDLQAAFDSIGTRTQESVRGQSIEFRIAQGTYRPQTFRREAFCSGTSTTASAASLTIRGSWGGAMSPTPDVQDFVATQTVLSADVLGNDGPGFTNRTDNCWLVLSASGRNFVVATPPMTIEGLTLQGGERATFERGSGGFFATPSYQSASPAVYVIKDSVIRENRSRRDGGGVVANIGTSGTSPGLTMIRCVVSNNHSDLNGGGCYVSETATVNMEDCVIRDNTAGGSGGGIWTGGYLSARRLTLAGNQSTGDGGGLFKSGNAFAGELYSSLIAANRSDACGGGVAGAGLNITSCTFVDNSAAWGGGLFLREWNNVRWSLFFRNSAQNAGQHLAGPNGPGYHDLNYVSNHADALFFPFTAQQLNFQTDIVLATPQLMNPNGPDGDPHTWQDNNYRPTPRSIAIDVIANNSFGDRDLDGNPRAIAGVLGRPANRDVGCFEYQLTLCPSDLTADEAVTIDDLLTFLDAFESGSSLADVTTNGQTPFPDNAVEINDLLYFLTRFEDGC